MTSNDIRIVINGQQFVVDGQSLKPAPENDFQQEVMKRFDGLESRMDGLESRVGSLESGMRTLAHQQEITAQKLDMGIWFTGICFGVLALVIAFIGIFAPKFWERLTHKESTAPAPSAPAPAPIVINTQPDINAIARQLGELYHLEPKR